MIDARWQARLRLQAQLRISGAGLERLMRQNQVTIRELASRLRVTQKRIREVRRIGLSGFYADEYHWAITGHWWTDLQINQQQP